MAEEDEHCVEIQEYTKVVRNLTSPTNFRNDQAS